MLQRVEPEEGDLRRVGMIVNRENAALVLRAVLDDGLRRRGLMHSAVTYTSSSGKEKG
jgi:hypothetical protein